MSNFRPRSAAEIADAAIQLLRRHIAELLPLSALLSIPNVLLGLYSARVAPIPGTMPSTSDVAAVMIPAFVSGVWWFLAVGTLVAAVSSAYLGESEPPLASARRGLSRTPALLGASLLVFIVTMLAFIASFAAVAIVAGVVGFFARVAGRAALSEALIGAVAVVISIFAFAWPLFLGARYLLTLPVIVIERVGPLASLRRSKFLSDGFTWRTVGLLTVSLVITVAVVGTLFLLLGTLLNEHAANAISSLVLVVLYPAWACLVVVLYYDLRIRKEGYDIELMARAMGEAAPPAPPVPPARGAGPALGTDASLGGAGH